MMKPMLNDKNGVAWIVCLLGLTAAGPAGAGLTVHPLAHRIGQEQRPAVVGFGPFRAGVASPHPALATAAERFRSGQEMTERQQHDIYRLLGIYTRQRYGSEAMAMLKRLVAFDTSIVQGVAQHENPNMIALGKALQRIADEFGLQYLNVDNRIFEITLPGRDKDLIGFHAHADVVPVNQQLWVLEDGTKLNPFQVTTIGNRMYGRGTQDDKNGIVVSLFAMKVIKEEGLPLRQTLRLIVDTTEETSSTAIPYYMERRPLPPYNLALDGAYPVVIAEKGYGTVMAEFPVREVGADRPAIVDLTGGLATNQIPKAATATFKGGDLKQLQQKIEKAAKRYVKERGADFAMETAIADGSLILTVIGVSAHSSQPQTGVNPVSRLLEFIAQNFTALDVAPNQFTDAAVYATANWGLDYYGKKIGIDFEHPFMGPLTAAQTYITFDGNSLKTAVNIRMPAGKTGEQLKRELAEKLDAWQRAAGMDITIEHDQREPMYRSPDGAWVKNLLAIASENLGIEPQFGSSNGATSAHNLPNGVQFGLALSTEKYTGHNANEFKTVDQFLLDLQIVTEAFIRLGNLGSMQ